MKIKLNVKNASELNRKLEELTTKSLKVGVLGNERVEGVPVKEYAVYYMPSSKAI